MKRIILLFLLAIPALQAAAQGCGNLVANGNFSAGNTGFSSAYTYNPVTVVAASTYAVVAQFNTVHGGFFGNDHTNPPTGLAMIINGSGVANTIVWEQTIAGITPNTTYYFSTWVNKQNGNPPPTLQFSINGTQIGSNFSPTTTPNIWQQFFASWFSGPNTSATIRLIDQQTAAGGNDFAIDDIFFTSTAPVQIASVTTTPGTCTNSSNGSITVTATGGVAPYQFSRNNGTNYTPGSNPHTFTGLAPGPYTIIVKDACGNVSNSQVVTVGAVDMIPPTVINCPGDTTIATGPNCNKTFSWPPPTATDNCPGAITITSTHTPGSTFPIGTTTVTYTFKDASNNSSTCSFKVTLRDNTIPTISGCPNNFAVFTGPGNTNCKQIATWTPPTAIDRCGGSVSVSSTHNPGDSFILGSTLVVYTFMDADSDKSYCYFYVTVVDNTAPRIVTPCPANITVSTGPTAVGCRARVSWTPPRAVDNCSTINTTSNYSPGDYFPVGTTTVTYTFKDAVNNTSTCSFNVTVVDNAPPLARCKPYTLNLAGGTGTVTAANIDNGSVDNCGIETMTVSPNTFTCAQAGTVQPVVLTVTDINGNVATCTAMVTVRYKPICSLTVTPSNNTYTGGVATNIYLGYGPQSATITTSASGGAGFTYSWSPSTNLSCSNCFNPIFTPTAPGIYTYTVTVTNSNGCSTTCTVTFCVKDVRVPGTQNVYICHEGTTMSVTQAQAASHLSSHPADRLGRCDQVCIPGARLVQNNTGNVIGQEVKVYPNPNKGSFVIDLPSFEDQAQIMVTDVQGKLIARKTVTDDQSNRINMNLGDVAKGMYFVEVIIADQRFRVKLIIE